MKTISTHAQAAKEIRSELKKAFPSIKFCVTSDSFAGGNSVAVSWVNGPTNDEVDKVAMKYQYGHFDCMQDIYEHTNRRNDIPQVKYVQTRREVCETVKQQAFEWLQKTHAYFNEVSSMDECNDNLKNHWSVWVARDYIYRILVNQDLTNGYQPQQ